MTDRRIEFEKMQDGSFCLWDSIGVYREGLTSGQLRAYRDSVMEDVGYVNFVPCENVSRHKGADS